MAINIGGNLLSSTGFNTSSEILNTPSIVTDGLVLWYDPGNLACYNNANSYYDCGYGCQYYGSDPGCTNCNTQLKDMSGNGYDGTLGSVSVAYSNVGGTTSFNGSTSVSFLNPLNQSNLTQIWTVTTWVNLSNNSGFQYVISGLNSGLFAMYNGTAPLLYLNSGANDYYTYGSGVVSTGVWHHLAYRFRNSDGTRTIWKDGVDNTGGGPNNTSTPSGQSGTFYLGSGLVGNMGEIQIYNRLLSDTEVLQNFNNGRQRFGV